MEELLCRLRDNDIDINVVDDQLKLDIPEGIDISIFLDEIKSHKQELISFIKKTKSKAGYRGIERATKKDHYVLSSVQRRMHFLFEFDKKSTGYNMPQAVLLEGDLDKKKLHDAFLKLIKYHECLRTYFETIDGIPVQKIAEEVEFEIEYIPSTEEEASSVVKAFVRPFDLKKAPIMRVGLIELSPIKNILIVDNHHIISDGISQGILIKDFTALYNNEELPELDLVYKDYAEWQQSEEQQQEIAKQKDFWLNEFSEELVTLELPLDFHRPLIKNDKGDHVFFELGKEETSKLKHIAEKERTTMFTVILAVYYILLGKLANSEDVVIGTPIAGRQHADLDNMMGMFVTALALRGLPKADSTYRELLISLIDKIPACLDNQAYPYEDLVDALKLERNASRNPLFDAMFAYENFEKSELKIPGLKLNSYSTDDASSIFDISLSVFNDKDILRFNFNYSIEIFKKETIERWATYLKKIVSVVVNNIDCNIGDIDIITSEEKSKLLNEFNRTEQESAAVGTTVLDLFEEQVNKSPDNIAVAFHEEQLSYHELDKWSNKMANFMHERIGVNNDDLIMIFMDKSIELIVSVMATWKSGGAYVPISTTIPEKRLQNILEDVNLKLIITDGASSDKLFESLKQSDLKVPCFIFDQNNIENPEALEIYGSKNLIEYSEEKPSINYSSDDLAYCIYTSGSTGVAKAVAVQHKQYLNAAYAWRKDYKLSDFQVNLLQIASFSFDVFAGDIARSLLNGGKLVICPDEIRIDFKQLVALLETEHISLVESTPALIIPLMDYIYENGIAINDLKLLIIGSDVCKFKEFKRVVSRFGGNTRIINSYGLTETTIDTSYYESGIDSMPDSGIVPIGKPMANMKFYILNTNLGIQPIGVPGEIFIGGNGVAKEYLNRPELTREKFIPDPFNPGGMLFKTGDLGRWLSDGNVEIIGRADNQVKIRGFRVELGEIENCLQNHGMISEALVVASGKVDKHLVAYYVGEEEINGAELRYFLSDTLPDYMIPSYYVQLDSIPLTPNGKINKRALPSPEIKIESELELPTNELEEKLVEIWSETLDLSNGQIGINKSFFELGGHSLKATFLVNKIYKELGVEMPLQEIFAKPTIKLMAEYIEIHIWLNNKDVQNDIQKTEVTI